MSQSILITQCLQNDFTKPIGKFDALPNLLHVGYEEARRLLSEKVEEGPVNTVIEWAYKTEPEKLKIIHIRDWHDDSDPGQKDHLEQFGKHCLKNTEGADFVFSAQIHPGRPHFIVDASGLNDFQDTNLQEVLAPHEKDTGVKVGIMGVWTEAKITFLAYELKTRYPNFEIAICNALCASSSRSAHFIATDQLKSILGVTVYQSIGDFTNFLTGTLPRIETRIQDKKGIKLSFDGDYKVSDTDEKILLYLFRDAKEVQFQCLDGGFSGNVVLKAKATDKHGHHQVPSVIKIGKREAIGKERTSFEQVQEVLGNNAPSITDFAELDDRGAIKYRYAAMLDNNVKTFQKYYGVIDDMDKIKDKLDIIFKKQLGRFYEAATLEKLNLLQYYEFTNKYAASIRQRVENLTGAPAKGDTLNLLGFSIPNVCDFYEKELMGLTETNSPYHYMSYLHGDLNGANVIIDAQENVWIIDFFHTHKGHVLKDLLKLENDILFIFMKINSQEEFKEAAALVDILLNVTDLWEAPDPALKSRFTFPQIIKAFETISILRSYYQELIQTDRDPYQMFVGLMRYSMHTMSFDECNDWQKKLALYAGAHTSVKIKNSLLLPRTLRIDFIEYNGSEATGKMGLTILPGRKDRARSISEDIEMIKKENISAVLSLITEIEFEEYGVTDLKSAYRRGGLESRHFPIIDQGVPSLESMHEVLEWMNALMKEKKNILIHCVGGLGRSGTVAACYLIKYHGYKPEDAINEVRKHRSDRAIESDEQEKFVERFAETCK